MSLNDGLMYKVSLSLQLIVPTLIHSTLISNICPAIACLQPLLRLKCTKLTQCLASANSWKYNCASHRGLFRVELGSINHTKPNMRFLMCFELVYCLMLVQRAVLSLGRMYDAMSGSVGQKTDTDSSASHLQSAMLAVVAHEQFPVPEDLDSVMEGSPF